MKKLIPLCLLLTAPVLHAEEVNKCVDANGKTTLTDVPCYTLQPKPAPSTPAAQPGPLEKPKTAPVPPIQPPPEQLIPAAPAPERAAKPKP